MVGGRIVVMRKKLSSSLFSIEDIEAKTFKVISKNENPNKKPDQNEEWSKRKCLCCNAIFDSWGIGNRLCKGCK